MYGSACTADQPPKANRCATDGNSSATFFRYGSAPLVAISSWIAAFHSSTAPIPGGKPGAPGRGRFGVGRACSSSQMRMAVSRHSLDRASSNPRSAGAAAASEAAAPYCIPPDLVVNAHRSSGFPEKFPSTSCAPSLSE